MSFAWVLWIGCEPAGLVRHGPAGLVDDLGEADTDEVDDTDDPDDPDDSDDSDDSDDTEPAFDITYTGDWDEVYGIDVSG